VQVLKRRANVIFSGIKILSQESMDNYMRCLNNLRAALRDNVANEIAAKHVLLSLYRSSINVWVNRQHNHSTSASSRIAPTKRLEYHIQYITKLVH
jgi:HSP90 family molecular chaperone